MKTKTFRCLLAITALLACFVFGSTADAAWEVTETTHFVHYDRSAFMTKEVDQIVIKLACTSDGAGTDYQLETGAVVGMYLYSVQTDPGDGDDAPTGVYTLDVEDDLNFHMLDLDGLTVDTIELNRGDQTLSQYPHIRKLPSVVVGTLGNGNTTDIYLTFVK